MKSIFTFYFSIDEKFKSIIAYFVINEDKNNSEIKKIVDTPNSDFYKLTEKSEDLYGIHDVSFRPNNELFGFTSYEIKEENIQKIMENYRSLFIKEGYEVDKVQYFEESYEEDEEDYDEKIELLEEKYNKIIEKIKASHE